MECAHRASPHARSGWVWSRSPASSWPAARRAAKRPSRATSRGRDRHDLRWHHGTEAENLQKTFDSFTEETGIIVEYTGDKGSRATSSRRSPAATPPTSRSCPQPGLLRTLVDTGEVKPAPEAVEANVDENWSPDWKAYGTVDDVFYAAPMMANVKGYVWYSPEVIRGVGRRGARRRGTS